MLPPTLSCIGALELDATIVEQPGEHAVDDGGADLALDVVADDGHAGLLELGRPLGVGGDEHGRRSRTRRQRRCTLWA